MAKWYAEQDVAALLDPAKLITRIEDGFRELAVGKLVDPQPMRIDSDEHAANYTSFPVYWPRLGLASVKVLSGVLGNPAHGRPMIDAVIVVVDATTGVIQAIMGGRHITALRTAATSALAVKYLAPGKGGTLTVIGTGAQGIAHAETLPLSRSFAEILFGSPSGDSARAADIARSIRLRTDLPVSAADAGDAVGRGDVVVLATAATTPVVALGDVKSDALLVSVGSFHPDETEIDPALAEAAGMTIADNADRLRTAWQSTDMRFAARATDLAALVTGSVSPQTSGLRVFLSDGRAFEDLAAAAVVLETAAETGFEALSLPGTLPEFDFDHSVCSRVTGG
ncbi:MAG: ornithine cyclodeaminase family protein [Hyphomicrobiales bacterium]|nr:ornithine cyclodeaminase family protein [Hyphomicrobiales bacterium]